MQCAICGEIQGPVARRCDTEAMVQALVDPPIERRSLRDEVTLRLRRRLLDGSLSPGARIVESTLCTEFGVSRTPLREALLQMEKEGLVTSEPAKGFVAAPLSVAEARAVFPIVWTLEALALRTSPTIPDAEELRRRQQDYEAAAGGAEARAADAAWHEALIGSCENDRLLELVAQQRRVLERYWGNGAGGSGPSSRSIHAHRAVLDALDRGDLEEAALRVETHWRAEGRDALRRLRAS